jgi:hypothetical protein
VQLGGEANVLVRPWRGKTPVAPGARHLAGKPGVARLRNGDHAGAVLAQQHRCYVIGFSGKNNAAAIAAKNSHKFWE